MNFWTTNRKNKLMMETWTKSSLIITLAFVIVLTINLADAKASNTYKSGSSSTINRAGGGGIGSSSSSSKNKQSQPPPSPLPTESSMRVQTSAENIKLKLVNGQLLVGNRKIIEMRRRRHRTSSQQNYQHHNQQQQKSAYQSTSEYSQQFYRDRSSFGAADDDTNDEEIVEQRIVYEFLGVPFAQPPLGTLRFQFPQRLTNILPEDKYNATYFRPSCFQEYDQTFPGFRGSEMWNAAHGVSEDCLYMNMWVPVTREQDEFLYKIETLENLNTEWRINFITDAFKSRSLALKASLFWIYGGSFNSGSANLNITDGTLLAGAENVIVVTFNYRTGPFGFLYLNNSAAPGNAGLADQVMVVEWFRENYMKYFGADENSICLFGESAGAMSLHYLMLTDKAHLFKRLIFQSSSSYSDLTYRPPSDAYRISLQLAQAEKINCLLVYTNNVTTNESAASANYAADESPLNIRQNRLRNLDKLDATLNYNDLIELDDLNAELARCLLNARAEDLSLAQFDINYVNDYLKMQFIPTLDYHGLIQVDPNEIDFRTAPAKIRERLNHDVLVGINKDEGSYFLFYLYNTLYFDLNGFLSPNDTKYDNKFVFDRLKEAFRTRYPAVVDETRHLEVESIQYRVKPKFDHRVTVLQLKKRLQDTTLIKANPDVDEFFYGQFVSCLSDLYKARNPSLITNNPYLATYTSMSTTTGRNLFDMDTNSDNLPNQAWSKVYKILGDYVFACPTIKLAANYSLLNPNRTFFYKFNKRSKENPWPAWTGVLHGYEIEYIFGVPWLQESFFDADDRRVSRRIMSYWANFAKHGRLYSPMDATQRRYLVQFSPLGQINEQMSDESDEDAEYELFNRIYENCGFMTKLNRYQSYATKYDMCMNEQGRVVVASLGNYSPSSFSSSFFMILLSFGLFLFILFG